MAKFAKGTRVVCDGVLPPCARGATGTVVDSEFSWGTLPATTPVYTVRWDNGDVSRVEESNLSAI
jgi:hypothetical protein